MGKMKNMHFLGFSRVLTSFRSCRSSNVGDSHSFSTPCISSPPPSPTTNQYQYPQNFPNVPVVTCSRCNCRSFSRTDVLDRKCESDVNPVEVIPAYLWRKEDKWHVLVDDLNKPSDLVVFSPQRSKIDSDDGGNLFPPLSIPKPSYRESKKATTKKKKVTKNRRFNNKKRMTKTDFRGRASTSSAETRLFSSDEDEDREFEEEYEFEDHETPIYSSNSLSTVVDDHRRNRNRRLSTESSSSSSMSSMFLRRMKRISLSSSSAVGGGNAKVRDSFAVMKRSNDPYSDFRRSMLEMVIEKQIYDASDLEDLLRCFLSLNKDEHHETIIKAFSNVRDGFFRS